MEGYIKKTGRVGIGALKIIDFAGEKKHRNRAERCYETIVTGTIILKRIIS